MSEPLTPERLAARVHNKIPSQEYLKQCFDYLEQGILIWKYRPIEHFNSKKSFEIFNSQHVGDVAGCIHENYYEVTINGVSLKLQRVIWVWRNGEIPEGYYIDHRDTNTTDNKILNLRLALPSQNAHNGKQRLNNTSGVKGVHWHKKDKRWVAHVTKNYKQKRIGAFINLQDAIVAINKARDEMHLEFANRGIK